MKTNMRKRSTAFMAILIAIMMSICLLSSLVACEDKTEDVGTITLSVQTLELVEGQQETITATTSVEKATVTWTTEDKAIATVSRGRVTGVKAGTTKIKASLSEEVYAECTVTVKADTRTITLDKTTATVDVKDTMTLTLTATTSDNSTAEWSTSNSDLATVENGVVTFKKTANPTAEVTITAKIPNSSKTAECVVTVNNSAIPADYAALAKNNSKKNLIGTPDDWQYFLKSAHASRVEFTDSICGGAAPYFANGGVNFEMASVSTDLEGTPVEGSDEKTYDETQYELRYQPGAKVGLAQGDVYTVTFKVESNVGGHFTVVKGGAGRLSDAGYIGDDEFDVNANEVAEITIEGCIVDDAEASGDPLAIRPRIYTMPETGNLLIRLYDFSFTKTSHEDSIGGQEQSGDSYKLPKANNDAGGAENVGKWSYYLSKDGVAAECALKDGTYSDGTVVVNYTNYSNNNCRIYYMPEAAMNGKTVKVSFKIKCNVAATIAIGGAGSGSKELEANVEQTVEVTFEVGTTALRLAPTVAEGDIADVIFTITEFTCVEAA